MNAAAVICLVAALAYAVASVGVKCAFHHGVSAIRATTVSNVIMAVVFQGFWLWSPADIDWTQIHLPVCSGLLYFTSQWLAFTALTKGDVSLATPLLGLKVLFVPFLALLMFSVSPAPTIRWACGLCFAGLYLLGCGRSRHLPVRDRLLAMSFSILAAALFALNDVVIQHWGPRFGSGPYLAIMTATMAVLSLLFLFPALTRSSSPRAPAVSPRAMRWLYVASIVIAVQAAVFAVVLVNGNNNAALLNVLYSTRSIWSVCVIVCFAGALNLPEAQLGGFELAARLSGSVCIVVSVLLVI